MEQYQREHPHDPRDEDLTEDHALWLTLLQRLHHMDAKMYGIFHGLRCGGSHLELNNGKIDFTFGDAFNNDFMDRIKKKYLKPRRNFIEIVMNKLAKDFTNGSEKAFDECPF